MGPVGIFAARRGTTNRRNNAPSRGGEPLLHAARSSRDARAPSLAPQADPGGPGAGDGSGRCQGAFRCLCAGCRLPGRHPARRPAMAWRDSSRRSPMPARIPDDDRRSCGRDRTAIRPALIRRERENRHGRAASRLPPVTMCTMAMIRRMASRHRTAEPAHRATSPHRGKSCPAGAGSVSGRLLPHHRHGPSRWRQGQGRGDRQSRHRPGGQVTQRQPETCAGGRAPGGPLATGGPSCPIAARGWWSASARPGREVAPTAAPPRATCHAWIGTDRAARRHGGGQCPAWSAGSSASSISTLSVDAGSRNAMRAPPWPMRGVSSRNLTPFAFSSARAPSMSSTSKQMW